MRELCDAVVVVFFFSSRRRHTRFDCDWSSDVCSSDLAASGGPLDPPILGKESYQPVGADRVVLVTGPWRLRRSGRQRSEEHTSELQSQSNLVCRLLLEKKKKKRSHLQNVVT